MILDDLIVDGSICAGQDWLAVQELTEEVSTLKAQLATRQPAVE